MNSNWDINLEQEVEEFLKSASPKQVAELLEKADVDHYNEIGAPLYASECPEDIGFGERLLGTSRVVTHSVAATGYLAVRAWEPKPLMKTAVAGNTEEMPLAA